MLKGTHKNNLFFTLIRISQFYGWLSRLMISLIESPTWISTPTALIHTIIVVIVIDGAIAFDVTDKGSFSASMTTWKSISIVCASVVSLYNDRGGFLTTFKNLLRLSGLYRFDLICLNNTIKCSTWLFSCPRINNLHIIAFSKFCSWCCSHFFRR